MTQRRSGANADSACWRQRGSCPGAGTIPGAGNACGAAGGGVRTMRTPSSPGNKAFTNPGVRSGRRPVMRGYTSSRK